MIYCNSRICRKYARCQNHIVNCQSGTYEVKDFGCNETHYVPVLCSNCGKYHVYANGVCKSCYQTLFGADWNKAYKPTYAKKGRPAKKERGLCQYLDCDHVADATSEYCWKHYQKIRRTKDGQKTNGSIQIL
jgi:hypothetical protein